MQVENYRGALAWCPGGNVRMRGKTKQLVQSTGNACGTARPELEPHALARTSCF